MIEEKGLVASYTDDIAALVASFSEGTGKQSLQQLLSSDPQTFCVAGIRILARMNPSAGSRHVAHLLAESKHAPAALLDSSLCTRAESVAAARAMAENGKKLETALEIALAKALRGQPSHETSSCIVRILDLLAALSAHSWWNSFQVELMAYADKTVRSKAALLIGRTNKNSAWISRRLMDRDVRVQANAVEALWELDGAESKPLLMAALKSKNNRVAGNAALGLYRLSDPKAIRALLDMALHSDPLFQVSALWAIGQTEDARFLPFLMEQFKTAQGKTRLAIARALAQIRRREKAVADLGAVQIHSCGATMQPGGLRRVPFALAKAGASELAPLKPTDVTIWEDGALVDDYELKSPGNPAVLIMGFVAPRFDSPNHKMEAAVTDGLKRCLGSKRTGDLWRIDRFALEETSPDAAASSGEIMLPYDQALATPELTKRHGCMAERDQIEKACSVPVPPERAAADLLSAVQRQLDAIRQQAGKRHIIAVLEDTAAGTLLDEKAIARLKQLAEGGSIAIHGIGLGSPQDLQFRSLCQSVADGSFHETTVEGLAATIEEIYCRQLNRFEITYSLPAAEDAKAVTLKISSSFGGGEAQITLSAPAS